MGFFTGGFFGKGSTFDLSSGIGIGTDTFGLQGDEELDFGAEDKLLQEQLALTKEQFETIKPLIDKLVEAGVQSTDELLKVINTPIDQFVSEQSLSQGLLPETKRAIELSNKATFAGLAPFGLTDSKTAGEAVGTSTADLTSRDIGTRIDLEKSRRESLFNVATLGTKAGPLSVGQTTQVGGATTDLATLGLASKSLNAALREAGRDRRGQLVGDLLGFFGGLFGGGVGGGAGAGAGAGAGRAA